MTHEVLSLEDLTVRETLSLIARMYGIAARTQAWQMQLKTRSDSSAGTS